jgi:hypothetical protein
MKKYLFGLGAMLVGAGLMFVFTHAEVSAESESKKLDKRLKEVTAGMELSKPETFVCSRQYVGDYDIQHCETGYLDCAVTSSGLSCVKKGGIFK